MPVAPGLHQKRTWHKEGLVTCYPVHEGGEINERILDETNTPANNRFANYATKSDKKGGLLA
jgi:hypothetical protein